MYNIQRNGERPNPFASVGGGGGHFVSYYIYVDVNMGFVLVKNLGYSFTGHTIAIIGFVFSSVSYFLDILKLSKSFLVQVASK